MQSGFLFCLMLFDYLRNLEKCADTYGCNMTGCESCGARRINDVIDKLGDYNISLNTLEEEDAKDNIRSDLITYLTQLNTEMTTLLTAKIESENGTLEQCDKETLEVINKIKAPLWMVVNTTLFGDKTLTQEMIANLKIALQEMRSKYCQGSGSEPPPPTDSCDLEEINQSYIWM